MSEYDELVKILRDGGWRGAEAADALEAMTEQRDRFVERFNEARLALQAAEAERDRLAGEVARLKDQNTAWADSYGDTQNAMYAALDERDRLMSALERCQAIGCSQVKEIAHRAISSLPISDCSCKIEMGSFRFRGSHCILCGGVIG